MKKFFSLCAMMVLVATSASAQRIYTHSVGVNLGNFEALSYKGFLFDSSLALQVDLGFRMLQTPVTSEVYLNGQKMLSANGTDAYWTFEVNPNLMYQNIIDSWDWGGISWYAGGGLSLGLLEPTYQLNANMDQTMGKFGVNAIGGVELGLDDAPLAISFDFRPGYGNMFSGYSDGANRSGTVGSFFDWAICIGVRYTL